VQGLLKTNPNLLRFGNIAVFAVTLAINGLAGTTLLNGRTTAQVSYLYSNPFTPAGYVFGIWGIIYTLLFVFVIYQALPKQSDKPFQKKIGVLFLLSGVFNIVWLFLWQYNFITASVIVLLALFVTLSAIYMRLHIGKSSASLKEKLCVNLPFSVYLGWITFAAIANVAAALVSVGWDGFGWGTDTWAIIAMGIALIATLTAIIARKDFAYSFVMVWALTGIVVNQNAYPTVVLIAQEAITLILVAMALSLLAWMLKRRIA
jgi:benzodiazapine receptor